MLIKPVQRFLKYPLMLQRLLKATPPPQPGDDATYFRELIMADEVANKVASAINEAKRGKELSKYAYDRLEQIIFLKIDSLGLNQQINSR